MPWKVTDVEGFNKGLSASDKRRWVEVANSALQSCLDDGGEQSDCETRAIRMANGVAKENSESMKRKLGKREFELEDFLVYGERGNTETWHLPVRYQGKPDAKMMERAWLALHGGYKGQMYDGPFKEKAVERLTKLYNETGFVMPEIIEQEEQPVEQPAEPVTIDARLAKIEEMLSYLLAEMKRLIPDSEMPQEATESAFEEVVGGHAVAIEESNDTSTPMRMDVVLIRPGWGNKRDMNYYTEDMLRRDAEVFVDAKMFESDHGSNKTNRDWVSTVERIKGVSSEGVLAGVVVHDDNFAERARALQRAEKLHLLECSIQASGTARAGTVNGVKGKIVEQINEARAVDWVTRAGAGGHAVSLS